MVVVSISTFGHILQRTARDAGFQFPKRQVASTPRNPDGQAKRPIEFLQHLPKLTVTQSRQLSATDSRTALAKVVVAKYVKSVAEKLSPPISASSPANSLGLNELRAPLR